MITSSNPRGRWRVGERNPAATLTDEQIVAIFLSTDSRDETAAKFGITPIYVNAIWRRARRADATEHLERPPRPKRVRKPPAPKPKPDCPSWQTPETVAFLQANSAEMNLTDLGFAMGVSRDTAQRRCSALGLTWKPAWTNEMEDQAADDFEPVPRTDWSTLEGPPGSPIRIQKLRQRMEQGVELWDDEILPALPRCVAKIETPEEEPPL